jgi:hypothetical protein
MQLDRDYQAAAAVQQQAVQHRVKGKQAAAGEVQGKQ